MNRFSTKRITNIVIAIVGLVSGVIGVYTFLQEKEANIQYEMSTNSNVLDLNTDLSKLDIIYDSTSLKDRNENLRVVEFRVKNSGDIDILKNFYDEDEPLGVVVRNGKIVEQPELTRASNSYLKKNLKLSYTTSGIRFSSVIFERKEFFDIKILIVHNKNVVPTFEARGKIAGVKTILIVDLQTSKKTKSIWYEAFSGDMAVQLIRLLSYLFGFIGLIAAIAGIVILKDNIEDNRRQNKNNRIIDEFRKSKYYLNVRESEIIIRTFDGYGVDIKIQLEMLDWPDEKLLKAYYLLKEKELNSDAEFKEVQDIDINEGLFSSLVTDEVISVKDGVLIKNDLYQTILREFVSKCLANSFE